MIYHEKKVFNLGFVAIRKFYYFPVALANSPLGWNTKNFYQIIPFIIYLYYHTLVSWEI